MFTFSERQRFDVNRFLRTLSATDSIFSGVRTVRAPLHLGAYETGCRSLAINMHISDTVGHSLRITDVQHFGAISDQLSLF